MAIKKCEVCGGKGYLTLKDDPTSRARCKCTLEALYRAKLGREVFDAKPLQSSKFAKDTKENMFFTANRPDFLPHIRYALISRGLNFFSRITNDSQMLDAWLSKERGKTRNDAGDGKDYTDYTSLRDLVEDPQLLIIFLGVVSYPNRALPGVLLEVLRIRGYEDKPTWVVNPHHQHFSSGHLCWSHEVEEHMTSNFKHITLAPSTASAQTQGTPADTDYCGLS